MVQKIQSDGVVLIGITGTNNKIDVIAPEQFFVIAVCIAAKIRLCGRLTRGIVFHDGNDITNIIVLLQYKLRYRHGSQPCLFRFCCQGCTMGELRSDLIVQGLTTSAKESVSRLSH